MSVNADEFERALRRDGFADIRHRYFLRGEDTQPHCHPFDTRLWIQEGSMTIAYADALCTYGPGEVFEISAGVEHCERYPDVPVRFVAGLRHR